MVRLERIPTTSRNQPPLIQPIVVPPPNPPAPNDSSDETTAETVRLLPLSCFIGSSACDPRNGDGCDEGATCDFSSESQLTCFPPPNSAQLDAPCNNSGGPCASGGWCAPDNVTGEARCHRVCCDDSECAPQGRSVSVSLPTPISAHSDFAEFQLKTTKMTKMPAIVSLPEQAARPAMTSAAAIATSVIVTNFSTHKKTI